MNEAQRNELSGAGEAGVDLTELLCAKPHEWWRVEVQLYDGTLLAIEPEMLAGKGDLTERDLATIRTAGNNLLGFADT